MAPILSSTATKGLLRSQGVESRNISEAGPTERARSDSVAVAAMAFNDVHGRFPQVSDLNEIREGRTNLRPGEFCAVFAPFALLKNGVELGGDTHEERYENS